MANTAEHKAAEQSLAEHLGYALPLPLIAKRALEWRLKQDSEILAAIKTLRHLNYSFCGGEYWKPPIGKLQREDAKLELIEKLKNGFYDNRHDSLESVLDIALDGFNISRKKD